MDLTNFSKQKVEEKKELIFENENVKIEKKGNKKIYFFKNEKGLKEYQNETFCNLTHSKILKNINQVGEFLDKSEEDNVEGIMIKKLNSNYVSGGRVGNMYKLKKTKEDFDLVIVGAEMGTGKRAGFFSSFLVACKNFENEFLVVGKVASGIKELGEEGVSMSNLTRLLIPLKKGFDEKTQMTFFSEKIIVQIGYQEIQKSQIYNSGIALRFPRLKLIREDKSLSEITDIFEIEKLI
jgi:DNA ligase-1